MIRDALAQLDLGLMSFSSLLFFLAFFALVFVRVTRPQAKPYFETMSRLPLEAEEIKNV